MGVENTDGTHRIRNAIEEAQSLLDIYTVIVGRRGIGWLHSAHTQGKYHTTCFSTQGRRINLNGMGYEARDTNTVQVTTAAKAALQT